MNKILFAGGGTGGHVYPGIALANEFCKRGDEVHFVGTKNHVEARIVPENGYSISFIWISGFQRSLTLKNLLFPLKLIVSLIQSFFLITKYKPDLVIGTGGYVSGPVLYVAQLLGKKTVIQEQNSYPGVTTKLLHSKVDQVHIAYEDAKNHLHKAKHIINNGNPTRSEEKIENKKDLYTKFNFNENITIAIIGGSLGAKSINECISRLISNGVLNEINVIWQTGKLTYTDFKSYHSSNVSVAPFYSNMNEIYSLIDVIICRAGAMTLAEIQNYSIPAIIVPYKYATGNHQYFNAKSLDDGNAAYLIKDDENLCINIGQTIEKLIYSEDLRTTMKTNMKKFSKTNATKDIVDCTYNLIKIK